MKILFLDDMPERTDAFTDWCLEKGGEVFSGLRTVNTAQKAIKVLVEEGKFDLIFLDHDLGEEHYKGSHDSTCGCVVMKWIVEHGPWNQVVVVVHSYNSSAAQRMVSMLLDAHAFVQEVDGEGAAEPPNVCWQPFGPGLKRFFR